MKVLITGIGGFAGTHLARFLQGQDCEVAGVVSPKSGQKNGTRSENIKANSIFECDVQAFADVKKILDSFKPDLVFHLAAVTEDSFAKQFPRETFSTNVIGTVNLLEAIRQISLDPMVLVAGSSAEYGQTTQEEGPIKETNAFRPLSFYGASKAAQAMVARQYFLVHGIRTIEAISFNYFGPEQKEKFVCAALAKQVALIEKGLNSPEIHVGNTHTWRDFTDVRDVVRAYWLLGTTGVPGEIYNVCSGDPISIQSLLEKLIGLSNVKINIVQDPEKMRAVDASYQAGNFDKLRQQTGWQPEIPLQESLQDILDYWRSVV